MGQGVLVVLILVSRCYLVFDGFFLVVFKSFSGFDMF